VSSPRSFDEKRARIAALVEAQPPQAEAALRRFIADKNGYLVGEAAQMASRLGLRELGPDLSAAFVRLLETPLKTDKGCFGKNRIVEALLALSAHEPDVYLAGLRHVQREPAFGGPIDTAAGLRGLSAHALLHIGYPNAVLEVVPLLADPEPVTRAEAAGALGSSGLDAAAAALHLKALLGDAEPDVLGACYAGLLRLLPGRYLPFVAKVLHAGEGSVAESAALALGESRLPEALAVLKEALPSVDPGRLRDSVLLGMALLRTDAANALLISLVEQGPEDQGAAALAALALHRHDEKLVERIRGAVKARGGKRVLSAFAEKFGGSADAKM
jgi:HEAT repeat protein